MCATVSGHVDRPVAIRLTVPVLTFALTLALRIHGIDRHFWMLRDQIRDWTIALGPFGALPLVGPATHVGGYTIGPAFYWILWLIRVLVGPWFDNLPHGGGIGQAMVQSAADALLLVAIWRRTGSLLVALASTVLVATAAYDLALSALVWNPMMGAALAKMATATVLIGWPFRSNAGVAVTAALAWSAVHCYTGAVFTALGIFAAIVAGPFARGDRAGAARSVLLIAAVVTVLQLPMIVHQMSSRTATPAMGAVTGSVGRIVSGEARPQFAASGQGFAGAFTFIQGAPWQPGWLIWVLAGCALVVLIKYRHDPALLSITLLPQILAIVGYAFYVGDFLDRYYYFSLMPAAVLTLVLGLTAAPSARMAQGIAAAILVAALAITPARIRFAATLHRMPEYGWLLDGSKVLVARGYPVKGIRTQFALPPSADPEFLYRILGGRIDPSAEFTALITREGQVAYQSH
jgi:hypothetical protein